MEILLSKFCRKTKHIHFYKDIKETFTFSANFNLLIFKYKFPISFRTELWPGIVPVTFFHFQACNY